MSSSIATIKNHCDAAIQAIQELKDIKKILSNYEADSQRLKEDVSSLLHEKQTLSQEIVDMKQQLRDLGEELTDTQDHVLMTHVYTTSDCSITLGDDHDDEDQGFPETVTEATDPSLESENDNDEPMNNLDVSFGCTQSVSSSSSERHLSVVHKKRRRSSSKWYKSPKKWRRMMRSNRLQSIILLD